MAKKKKDDEENRFAEGLGGLGKALSAKQERESTLESLATIADAAATWMKVRARNQDIEKERLEVQDQPGVSLADIERFDKIQNDKSNLTEFFGKDSDVTFNYFKEANVLNPEDPTQSLLGNNFQVNMSSMSDIIENTQYKAFTDQQQSKFAEAIKQSGGQTIEPVTPNNPPNAEAQSTTTNLINKEVPESAKTEIEETDTKVEETEVTEQDQTDNVVVEEPVTTDAPIEDTTDYFEDDDKKKIGSLFGKAK